MSLLDTITGGKSSDATEALQQGLDAIRAVRTPTADDLKFEIQKLVQTGQITPTQAQTFLQNPNALLSEKVDQTGNSAQEKAISELLGAANEGGVNPAEEEKLGQILQTLRTTEKGANDAVLQNQAARGTLTGGETLAAQLENNQNAAVNANQAGLGTAAEGYNAMLNELTSAGSMGANLQGQQNTQANTVAAATNAINQFNAAQQQGQENLNVGAQNAAQAANTETAQNIEGQNVANENTHAEKMANTNQTAYEDAMQKAAAEAGVSENIAKNDTTQGGQQAGLLGGIIGAGGQVGAGLASADPAAPAAPAAAVTASGGGEIERFLKGGVVGGHAAVPGNSPKNDTVPAVLSPGEIVLPRTVAQNPQPDKVMGFLNRIRQAKQTAPAHPHDVKSVLDALALRRAS